VGVSSAGECVGDRLSACGGSTHDVCAEGGRGGVEWYRRVCTRARSKVQGALAWAAAC
jgi:hypothetical protein